MLRIWSRASCWLQSRFQDSWRAARLAGMLPETGLYAFAAGSIAFAAFGANRFMSVAADDTRMTEKHYAHLAPSHVASTIRAHFPALVMQGGVRRENSLWCGKRVRYSAASAASSLFFA